MFRNSRWRSSGSVSSTPSAAMAATDAAEGLVARSQANLKEQSRAASAMGGPLSSSRPAASAQGGQPGKPSPTAPATQAAPSGGTPAQMAKAQEAQGGQKAAPGQAPSPAPAQEDLGLIATIKHWLSTIWHWIF